MIATHTLRKAMRDIAEKKGPFTLFGIFKRVDGLGAWDIVVAAPWLDKGQFEATGELVALLAESIGEEELRHFASVQTLNRNDPTVKAILKGLTDDCGDIRLKSTSLFGLQIEEAIILGAKTPVHERLARPTMASVTR